MTADPGDGSGLQHRPASMVMLDVVGCVRLMELDERNLCPLTKFRFLDFAPDRRGATRDHSE
jgi:hypothetical protein